MAQKTILVTGSAGFIGSKTCELLMANNYSVVGIDNLNDAYDVRLKEWRLAQLKNKYGFKFYCLNINDYFALRQFFETYRRNEPDRQNSKNGIFDAVINLAARAGVRQSVENPWVYFETNVTGTLNLLECCREFKVKKFVLASTSSLYGANNPQPYQEVGNTDGPLSPYAASKKSAEALCYVYHYLYGIDMTILRYFTVYGPAGRPDMSLFRFVQRINEDKKIIVFGDGKQSRDFTFVDDIARGTIAGLKPLGHAVINLGSDDPIVLGDAIGLIESLLDRKAKIEFQSRHPADILATWADIGKAEKILEWSPQTKFRDGITCLVDWYRQNRSWAKDIHTG